LNPQQPLYLDASTIRQLLTPDACRQVVADAMKALSSGQTIQKPREVMPLGDGRIFGLMPGALGPTGYFGAKLISVFDDPEQPGRQAHRGVVILFEGQGGHPVCIADAEEITLVRTAAASAVATDILARPDAHSLGIFGCGHQAAAHIDAIARIRPLDEVLVWGRNHERAQAFAAASAARTGLDVRAVADPRLAAGADIICTVTTSAEPVLLGEWVRPGAHVNAVGSSRPGKVEVDQPLVLASRYIADSRASALLEAAEFLDAKEAGVIGDDHIRAEIGEILLGTEPGRVSASDITFYKSVGHPVQDLASAAFAYQCATDKSPASSRR